MSMFIEALQVISLIYIITGLLLYYILRPKVKGSVEESARKLKLSYTQAMLSDIFFFVIWVLGWLPISIKILYFRKK